MSKASLAARLLRRWHKRLGLVAAIFFAFLAFTGLALNHGDTLELDAARVSTPWLMAWYGLKPAVPEQAFQQDGLAFCWQGDTWVLSGRVLKPGHGEPLGVVRADDQIWIASADEIQLYDAGGRLVDKIERDLLPAVPLRRIGKWKGRLAANAGPDIYATADGIAWERLPADAVVAWSRLSPLAPAQQRELAPLFAPSLPWQRVLADLHSGRIFGRYGVLATDALAGILLVLSGSGFWLYFNSRSRKHAQPKATGSTQLNPARHSPSEPLP